MTRRKPLYTDLCKSELWEGVRCTLPAGHQGSHQRPATDTSCAISWRSSTFPPPVPAKRCLPPFRVFTSRRPTMDVIGR
ncbi:MAG TPA: hypothetical protein VIV11_18815 [Kofleriaceae bacterium]